MQLNGEFFVSELKDQTTQEQLEQLADIIKISTTLIVAKLQKQRESAVAAEEIIDKEFESVIMPSISDWIAVVNSYHHLSRYIYMMCSLVSNSLQLTTLFF